eukprot:804526_1
MANQVAQREIAHKQRIVEQNSNSTFSKIILPSFKDIWDFQNSYQGVDALDGLRQASVALSREFSLISECYKQRGNAPSTAIRIYTLQSFVYAALNEALREDKPEILKLFAPYIYQLVHGLNYEKIIMELFIYIVVSTYQNIALINTRKMSCFFGSNILIELLSIQMY